MIAFIGPNPVPPATNIIGQSLSSLRKKLPFGPSILKIVFSVKVLKTKLVNCPPSTKRTCSSIKFELTGALAIEKARGSKSGCSMSRY